MWHSEATTIGPPVNINGREFRWFGDVLMDGAFNSAASIETIFVIATQRKEFILIVYMYKDGYRYTNKRQVLPMAEDIDTAKRMAIPILTLLLEK